MSKMKNYAKSYSRMALNKKNKYASNCGAGSEGNKGFQSGNTCGGEGGGSEEPKKPKKPKKSDTGAGDGGGEYETESIDQLSGNDLHDTAQHLTELSQFGMSTEEMAQKTDISPDAIKDILDWYDTDPEDRGAGDGGGVAPDSESSTWFAPMSGSFDLDIPQEGIDDMSGQGAADDAVAYWHSQIDMSHITDEQLFAELNEHDLGEANMKDRESQEQALLWIAANDISEDPDMYAPDTGAGDGGGLEEQERNLTEALGMSGSTEEEAQDIIDSASASQDVIPQWGSSSEMRVWIGSEGAYSEGKLIGEWVDATDVVEATESLTKKWQEQGYGDEWAVMDSEGVPDSLHHDMEGIANYANTLQSHDNPEALQAYADTSGLDFEDAVAQFEDAYAGDAGRMSRRGQYDLPMGFVEDYVDSTGGASEFLANQSNPYNYIDRESLVRDLSMDNRYDIQEERTTGKTIVVDEDGETVHVAMDADDAEMWIKESDEEFADELIESGGLSNPDFYFDYEQLAYDMVIGGDIMVSTDNNHVFWNM